MNRNTLGSALVSLALMTLAIVAADLGLNLTNGPTVAQPSVDTTKPPPGWKIQWDGSSFRACWSNGNPSLITQNTYAEAIEYAWGLDGVSGAGKFRDVVLTVTNASASVLTNLAPRFAIKVQPFTNVVSGDNRSGCGVCKMIRDGLYFGTVPAIGHERTLQCAQPYREPTERWTITTIGVRHIATMSGFQGQLERLEVTSCTTNRERLQTTWEVVK